MQPELEHLWLKILGRNKHSKALIGIMYWSTRILSTPDWQQRVEVLLSHNTVTWDRLLILTGDMNIDRVQPLKTITKQYQTILDMFDLKQMIISSTYWLMSGPRRITCTGILPCSIISDHDGIYACVNVPVSRYQSRHKYIRNIKF